MVKDPLIGRLVDSRYEIVDQVARGGMATVYLARDRRLDRDVAFKLMHAHLADSPDFVSRFRREARAAARLSNPGVVSVYDQGSLDGVAYLVMEYVEGPTLRDLMAAGPLSVKEALGLVAQLLRPLGAAHRAGLVHRDIKPENVLLPSDGSVAKVADFGLARAVTEVAQTTTGNVLGTVAYLAPELITSGASTSRADVFSAGVVLYELLTGELPFHADSPIQVAFHNVHDDMPLPSALVPDMPADVDELVTTMTRRDPDRRPEDADAALRLLRDVVEDLTDSELAVRRGGGTASVRTQEVMAANAQAARAAITEALSPQEQPDTTPSAGMRTVSLPIGSIGPGGRTQVMSRSSLHPSSRSEKTLPVHTERTDSAGPVRSRRALLTGTGALIVAAGSYAAWYGSAGPGRRVTVPDIVGMAQQDAQATVEAEGLVWAAPARDYSDTVPAGRVISCSPAPGARTARDQEVTAVISRGTRTVPVPDVVGRTEKQAREAIEDVGLTIGPVTRKYSDDTPSGTVVSTDPQAGTTVNRSSAVAIVVSRGRQPARVPDVVSMSEEEARTAIKEAGLEVGEVSRAYSDKVSAGQVISSSPKAGASGYYHGDKVDITVSLGPETVTVPDVVSMSEEEARTAIEEVGLAVKVKKVLGGLFDTVRSTSPSAGTSVKVGTTVVLTVY